MPYEIIAFPTVATLNRILANEAVDIISPFYSGWSLGRLQPERHSRIRFITRLPTTFVSPPPFLDNDPRPLHKALGRMGSALSVYAMPSVHAKLYLTAPSAWLGSANFTRTGFSGIGELLLEFTPPLPELVRTFSTFERRSTRVTEANIDFLVESVRSGLTTLTPKLAAKDSIDAPIDDAISYDDFRKWIERRTTPDAAYIAERIHNKYRMSGHAYSGFHGVFSFLKQNPAIAMRLLKQRRLPIPDDILSNLAVFVTKYGEKFGGPRGGTWRSKLSVKLGGVHTGGGAGDVMVKRLLLQVPRYMRDKHLV
jgi:hypothetical protein